MQHALPPLKIRVLLWNINGPGEADPRNLLVPGVVEIVNPDAILLQEIITMPRVEPIIRSDKYGQVFAKDDKECSLGFFSIKRNSHVFLTFVIPQCHSTECSKPVLTQ